MVAGTEGTASLSLALTLDPDASSRYSYNRNGQLVSRSIDGRQTLFSYDALGHIDQITQPDGTQRFFSYDADGRRTQEAKEPHTCGTQFLYDGFNVLLERDGVGKTTARNVWGLSLGGGIGGLLSRQDSGKTLYYHYDGSGNVIELTDSSAAVVQRYTYDAFGNLITEVLQNAL